MATIGSDGLNLLIGDGGMSEVFNPLKGASLKRLEITQRLHAANAISSDGWQIQAGASDRKLVIECEAYATDDVASLRLRSLAMSAGAGNIRLMLSNTQMMSASMFIARYNEVIEAGNVKRLSCRMESTGGAAISG